MLLIATTAFRCPGPDPQVEPGSGGGGGTTTTGEGAAGGGGSVSVGVGGEGGCGPTDSNPMNCGACGRQCLVGGPTVMPVCTMGVCSSVCASGSVNISRPAAPAPDDGCEAPGRRVFVSTATRQGNFGVGVGGPFAADMICQNTAMVAGLGGMWMAWLSDMASFPAMRFTKSTVPYVLLDGTQVAASWDDLIAGLPLSHAIDQDEHGVPAPTTAWEVWTGTTASGDWLDAGDCLGWTSPVIQDTGYGGLTTQTSTEWTLGLSQFCDRDIHFYCFEQ